MQLRAPRNDLLTAPHWRSIMKQVITLKAFDALPRIDTRTSYVSGTIGGAPFVAKAALTEEASYKYELGQELEAILWYQRDGDIRILPQQQTRVASTTQAPPNLYELNGEIRRISDDTIIMRTPRRIVVDLYSDQDLDRNCFSDTIMIGAYIALHAQLLIDIDPL